MAAVGVVKSITGQAMVVNERGERHILKVGEKLQAGEHVVTGPGSTVSVQLANGKMVDLAAAQTIKVTQNLAQTDLPDAGENAVNQATIQSVIQAVAEGRDINEVLGAPAAGAASAGSDGNATFVNLERISITDPNRSTFNLSEGSGGGRRGGNGDDNRGNDDQRNNKPASPNGFQAIDDQPAVVGAIANGSTTNDAKPEFTGTGATPGNVITVLDGGKPIGSAVVKADGTWTVTPTTQLSETSHTITTTATNPTTGAVSDPSAPLTFTVDTTAPNPPTSFIATDDVAPVVGQIANNSATNDALPEFTGKGATPGDVITVLDGGKPIGSATVKADGTWSVTPTTPLTDDKHTITTTATDLAGNTSVPSEPLVFTVDTKNPDAASISGQLPETKIDDTGTSQTDNLTRNGEPTLTGTTEKPTDTVVVTVNGTDYTATVTADANGKGVWSVTLTGANLIDGTYTPSIKVTDLAGNSTTKDSEAFTVDTTPPSVPTDFQAIDDQPAVVGSIANGGKTNDAQPEFTGKGATPGDVITVLDDGKPIGSATVNADGTWSVTPATPFLDASSHSITTTATDPAGNTSAPSSPPLTFTIDTTAPNAPVITGVNDDIGTLTGNVASGGSTDDTKPTVSGTGEPGATITVYDGKTPVGSTTVKPDGTWSVDTPLLNGSHPLTAVATDPAGNTSLPSAPYTINVDTNGPVDPAIVRLDDNVGSIQTPIQKDGVTDDTTPTIVGTAGANLTVNLYDNGVLIGSTTTDAKGDWTFTPSTPLKEGLQNIQAAAVSAAGVESGKTGDFKFTIDTTAPTGTTLDGVTDNVGLVTGPVANGGTTDDNTPTLSGTGEPGATITLTDNGQPLGTTTVKPDGTWSFTPTTPIADGSHSVTVTATDPAGNTSPATAPATFTVDTSKVTDPTINSATDNTDPQQGVVANGGATNDTTPTLAGEAPKGTTVEVFAKAPDGTTVSLGTVTTDATGHWTLTPSTPLAKDGQYDFTAQATNIGTGAKSGITPVYSLNLDTVAPVAPSITSLTDDVGTPQGTIASGGVTDDATPTITGKGEKAGDTIQVFDGTTLLGTTTVKSDGTWTLTPTTTLTDGVHNLTAKETDAAGNVSPASTAYPVTIDTTAPNAPVITGVNDDIGTLTGNVASGGSTDDTKPTVSGTGEPGATITVYDGKTPVGSTTVKPDGTWSVDTPLLNGSHPLTAVATDPAGNTSLPSAPYTINVDTNGPVDPAIVRLDDNVGSIQTPIQKDGVTDDTTPTIVGTAGANLTVNLYDNGVLIGSTTTDAKGDWTFTPSTPLKEGLQNIQAAAVSAAGVESGKTGDFKFTIDTTAPTGTTLDGVTDNVGLVTGPVANGGTTDDNTPTLSGTGEPGATITLTDNGQPLGTTTVKPDGTWSFTPTTPIADGSHSVTVTATDPAGNTSPATAPATFTVDTSKVTDPTINSATDNTDPQQGVVANGGATNDTTPTLAGEAPKGTTVEVFAKAPDGTTVSLGTVTTDATGHWTLTPSTPLAKDGQYDFTAQATNIGTGAKSGITPVYSLNLDTVAPVAPSITSLTDDVGTPQGTIASGGVTDDATPTITGKGEKAGDTIQVFDGTTLLGTTTVKSDGTWTLTPTTTLTDGVHNLTAKETDAAGNVSPASTAYPVTIDTTAPNAPVITGVNDDIGTLTGNVASGGSTDDTKPTVSGTGEPGATITVYDGKTPVGSTTVKPDGTWSVDTPLLNGSHPLTAVATDPAGNTSLPSAPYTINVDTNGPVDPAIVRLDDNVGSIQTPIQKDGVTDDTTPTIVGTAGANLTVNLYDNGVLIGSTTTDAKGDWTFTPSTPLKEGLQNIQAAAVSAAGVESGKTGDFKFTIDTTAPTGTTLDGVTDNVGLVTGPVANGGTTDDNTPTLSGTGEPGATITLTDNGQPLGTTTVKPDGTWSFTPTTPIADGSHSVTVTATDPAGNTSPATAPATFTVDTSKVTDPTINSATDNTDPQQGVVANGGATNDTTPTLAGEAPKGTTVEVFAKAPDGTTVSLGTVTTDATGHWTLTPSTPLAKDGQYDFTAQATNIGTGAKSGITPVYSLNLDTVAPVAPSITSLTDDVGTPQGTIASGGVTDDATPTITGKGEKAGDTIQVFDGTTLLGTTTVKSDGTWTLTPTTTLTDGVHNLTAKETDAAGNVSPASTAYPVTIDTTAPNAPVITGVNDDIGTLTGNVASGGSTDDTKPTVSGTGEPGATITVYDGKTPVGSTTVKPDGTWSVDTPLLNGSHPLTAVATDPAGNTSLPSAPYTINVDTNGPVDPAIVRLDDNVGSIQTPIQKDGVTDDTTPTIVGTAGANLTVNLYDNGVLIGSTTTDAKGDWTFTPSTPLKEGLQNIQAAAVSAAGVESGKTGDFKFTIDTTAPTGTTLDGVTDNVGLVTGPVANGGTTDDNTPTLSGTGEPGATITLTDNGQPLGTTTVKPDGTWSFTPTTPIADGSHSVTVTATDPAGNTSPATAPATFTVDTSKVTDPTINSATDNTDPQQGVVANGGATNDTTPTLAGEAPKGTTVEVFAKAPDGTTVSLGTVTTDATGHWTLTPSTPLAKDGQYDFTAQATNIGTGAKSGITPVYSLNLDTVAPVAPSITSLTDDVGTPQGTIASGGVTDDATPTITGKGEKAGDTIQVFDGTTLLGTTTVKSDGTWTLTPTTTLTDGVHNLTAKETDAAGNVSPASTAYPVTIDTTAPNAPVITTVVDDFGKATGNIASGGSADDATPTLKGTAEANATVTVFDNGKQLGTTKADANGNWTFTPSTDIADGLHNYTATATDKAGNSSVSSDNFAYTLSSVPTPVHDDSVSGPIVFQAYSLKTGNEVWVTDGTTGGTKLLSDIIAGAWSGILGFTQEWNRAEFFDMGNGMVLFQAYTPTNGIELWVTDGTTAGTHLLKDINTGAASSFSALDGYTSLGNGKYIFTAYTEETGRELWVTDGTTAGTYMVKDIYSGVGSSFLGTSGSDCDSTSQYVGADFTSIGDGKAIFQAYNPKTGIEIWITDGTASGTYLLKDINTGVGSSYANDFTLLGNGLVVFEAYTTTNGYELWVTDGTTAGTTLLKDIYSSVGSISTLGYSSNPTAITETDDGKALFWATNYANGQELWITDGTAKGTYLLKDINAGVASSRIYNSDDITSLGNGKYLFSAYTEETGIELWVTDLTTGGTHLLKDVYTGAGSSILYSSAVSSANVTTDAYSITQIKSGWALFQAYNAKSGAELWITDGENAWLVSNINSTYDGYSSFVSSITATGDGNAIFTAYSITDSTEPYVFNFDTWKTLHDKGADTSSSVSLLSDINPYGPSYAQDYTLIGGGHEDTTYYLTSDRLLSGWSDPTNGTLSVSSVTVNHGTATLMADGRWQISPEANFNGTLEVSYNVVSSSGAKVAATLDLTIDAETDVFKYTLADNGTAGTPNVETITHFDTASRAQDGDVLDIRDLLQGESKDNLQNYLHFEKSGSDTIVHVSANGGFSGDTHAVSGTFSSGKETAQIVLSGVDLTAGSTTDASIIANMLAQQKLITD